jgi:hypothetical protein
MFSAIAGIVGVTKNEQNVELNTFLEPEKPIYYPNGYTMLLF